MTSSRSQPSSARRRRVRSARRAASPPALRTAGSRDVALLVDHRHRMFASIARWSAPAMARHDRAYRTWVRPRLRSGEVIALIAELPEGPVASGVLWWREDQPRPGVGVVRLPYVMSVYTEPKLRGRGLASRIVQELVRAARAGGASRITLHASDMGRSVYAQLGFERTWEMRKWLDLRYVRARTKAMAGRGRAGSRA